MNIGKWKNKLRQFGYAMPFTVYFFAFGIFLVFGMFWLKGRSETPDSSFAAVFVLMIRVTLMFCFFILGWGAITALISWFFLRAKIRSGKFEFRLEIPENEVEQSRQKIGIHMRPILKPLFGFVRIRLIYNEGISSSKISLVKPDGGKLFSNSITGFFYWELPEIREYSVSGAIIYLEDLFQFFSFTVKLNSPARFTTHPIKISANQYISAPRKTEDTAVRIEELKRVEGELLNYKDFETSDDVRRIVWKIYAKNKELVVRVPEILDPYASHIYLFPSFFSRFHLNLNEQVNRLFLNYYKSACWSIYESLLAKGFVVKYCVDDGLQQRQMMELRNDVRRQISKSEWQKDHSLLQFIDRKSASVAVVSSFCDLTELKMLMDEKGNEISFIFVKLSDSFNKNKAKDWLRWLFVKEADDLRIQKIGLQMNPVYFKVLQNEQEIEKLLKQFEKSVLFQTTDIK